MFMKIKKNFKTSLMRCLFILFFINSVLDFSFQQTLVSFLCWTLQTRRGEETKIFTPWSGRRSPSWEHTFAVMGSQDPILSSSLMYLPCKENSQSFPNRASSHHHKSPQKVAVVTSFNNSLSWITPSPKLLLGWHWDSLIGCGERDAVYAV